MTFQSKLHRAMGHLATATMLSAGLVSTTLPISSVSAQTVSQRASSELVLSVGRGQLITLPEAISDVLVSNERVADVQVRSPRQIYIFAKSGGESTVFATTKSGRVVYSANVRAQQNVNSLDSMLRLAMPESTITATTMNGLVLLTGTVATPEDAAEAERLTEAYLGQGIQVLSRLKTATPLQVQLQVKIVEVSRDVSKQIGFNFFNAGNFQGTGFFFGQGRNIGTITPATGGGTAFTFRPSGKGFSAGLAGRFLGMDVLSAIDLAEEDGLISTLAQPNLTALSGETASFLAGGEIPIPINQGQGSGISVEFKQYGVSLAFTPTVLSDGRISMRVRPEVSQITFNGAVTLNGFAIPALSTRRTETTVELGSGQSFMIGGLLSNTRNNTIEKAPYLGDLPILGALFRSKSFRRNETELMVVVTPYLVKPVSASQLSLPTDGYKAPNDDEFFLFGKNFTGNSGEKGPAPKAGDPITLPSNAGGASDSRPTSRRQRKGGADENAASPGFEN
jgi:pilus assembly protein CpaC